MRAVVVELLESRRLLSVTVPTFSSATSPTGKSPTSIAVADFNKDGKLDYISANAKSGTVTVGFGKGTGLFGSQQQIGVGSTPIAVVIADFNKDNNLDFAVALQGSNQIVTYLGNGAGVFTKADTFSAGKLAIPADESYGTGAKLVAGDFDGDGKLDLATFNSSDHTVSVMRGQGNGLFSARVTTATPSSFDLLGLAAGDFNRDGKTDLAVSGYASLDILFATMGGKFAVAQSYAEDGTLDPRDPILSDTHDVIAADFNNDTFLDLAVVNGDLDTVELFRGSSNGHFSHSDSDDYGAAGDSTMHSNRGPIALAAGDFNKDGFLDLVVANPTLGTRTVLTNDGTGSFPFSLARETPVFDETVEPWATGPSVLDIAVGDFNGDTKLDILLADGYVSNVTILTNTTGSSSAQLPVVNSFSISPSTFQVGTPMQLTANATETNGTIANVKFYIDVDGTPGLNPNTDFFLGTATSSTSTFTLTANTSQYTPGTYTVYAYATDGTGQTAQKSAVITATATSKPVINSFTVNPTTVYIGDYDVFSASASAINGSIANVKFYIETDGKSGVDVNSDQFLGTGTLTNGAYVLNVDTTHFMFSDYNVYAVATDTNNVSVQQTAVLAVRPRSNLMNSFTITPNPTTVGSTVTLTATANEPFSKITSFTFYRETNGLAGLQRGSDTVLGTVNSVDGTTSTEETVVGTANNVINGIGTITVNTAGMAAGTYTYYAFATDLADESSNAATAILQLQPVQTPPPGTLLAWEVGSQTGGGKQGLAASTVATGNVNSVGLTKGIGLKSATASKGWGASGWAVSSTKGLNGDKNLTFGLTVAGGYKTSLSSIDFHYRRSIDGPANVFLEYQLNNGAWITISDLANAFPDASSGGANVSLNVAGVAALQNLAAGTSVNFRITPYGASASTATWYIYNQSGNDLVVKGTSTATP